MSGGGAGGQGRESGMSGKGWCRCRGSGLGARAGVAGRGWGPGPVSRAGAGG